MNSFDASREEDLDRVVERADPKENPHAMPLRDTEDS